jgi:uncharacterized membrane protein
MLCAIFCQRFNYATTFFFSKLGFPALARRNASKANQTSQQYCGGACNVGKTNFDIHN